MTLSYGADSLAHASGISVVGFPSVRSTNAEEAVALKKRTKGTLTLQMEEKQNVASGACTLMRKYILKKGLDVEYIKCRYNPFTVGMKMNNLFSIFRTRKNISIEAN